MFAPLLGAGLYAAIDLRGILVLDLASYVFAIGVLAVTRFPDLMGRFRREPFGAQFLGGLRLTWFNPYFRTMLIFYALLNLVFAVPMLMMVPLVLSFGSLVDVGWAAVAEAIGALIGGLVMAFWGGPRKRMMVVNIVAIAVGGAFAALSGVHPSLAVAAAGVFGSAVALSIANAIYLTVVQIKVPQRFHGRVFALNQTLMWSTFPLAFALVPPLVDRYLEPLLMPGGALADSLGALIGTGPGRGIGLSSSSPASVMHLRPGRPGHPPPRPAGRRAARRPTRRPCRRPRTGSIRRRTMTAIPHWTLMPEVGSASVPIKSTADGDILREAYEWVIGWLAGDEPGTDPAMALGPQATLVYDTEKFDATHALRVAGHIAATAAALIEGPLPEGFSPLSDREREHLVHGLDGSVRELPARPFHELFAQRAAQHPDTVAATSWDGQAWTYGELDRAANRVANGLLERGLTAEEVVGVATGRTLGWLAAIIGIFKAGGAYLPIEPDYPPARIADADGAKPRTLHHHLGAPRRTNEEPRSRAGRGGRLRPPRLRLLHLRFDRAAQGRDV
jgi:hypothetical protein